MHGKTVVISGATSGIGFIAARALAKKGARIVFIARDAERGKATLADLRAIAPDRSHAAYYADLSSVAETVRVAAAIAADVPRIDVLINNAGAVFRKRYVTAEGLERTFALNHMSYFVLTLGLLGRLIDSAPARIINTASNAHRNGHLDFADLQSAQGYKATAVYGTSKLCNILFTRELSRRLSPAIVTANSFSPGFVATRFGDQSGGALALGIRVAKLFAGSPEKGAATLVHLASAPDLEGVSGGYFYRMKRGVLTAAAQDDAAAARLWTESEKLMGVVHARA